MSVDRPASPGELLVLRHLAILLGINSFRRFRLQHDASPLAAEIPDTPDTPAEVRRFVADRVALLDCNLDTALFGTSWPDTLFGHALLTADGDEFAEVDGPLLTALVRRGVSLDCHGYAGRAEDMLLRGWRATTMNRKHYATVAAFIADERACRARWGLLRVAWVAAVVR